MPTADDLRTLIVRYGFAAMITEDDADLGYAIADAWDADRAKAGLFKSERDDAEAKVDRIANGIAVLGEENIALRKQLNAKLGQHYAEVCRLTKRIEDLRKRLEAAEKAVPTTWLDPLLSGPDAVSGLDRCDGNVIEALLRTIRLRIAALAAAEAKTTRPGAVFLGIGAPTNPKGHRFTDDESAGLICRYCGKAVVQIDNHNGINLDEDCPARSAGKR